jgi:Mrp family chromosome partitioning ATPase
MVALPKRTRSIVGRGADLALIGDLLERDEVRLLTLTGPGGVGKTRLAVEAAWGAAERSPWSVVFIDRRQVPTADHRRSGYLEIDAVDEPEIVGHLVRVSRCRRRGGEADYQRAWQPGDGSARISDQ